MPRLTAVLLFAYQSKIPRDLLTTWFCTSMSPTERIRPGVATARRNPLRNRHTYCQGRAEELRSFSDLVGCLGNLPAGESSIDRVRSLVKTRFIRGRHLSRPPEDVPELPHASWHAYRFHREEAPKFSLLRGFNMGNSPCEYGLSVLIRQYGLPATMVTGTLQNEH